jgi:hypothetical protein
MTTPSQTRSGLMDRAQRRKLAVVSVQLVRSTVRDG